jgi:hypothetical protein
MTKTASNHARGCRGLERIPNGDTKTPTPAEVADTGPNIDIKELVFCHSSILGQTDSSLQRASALNEQVNC